MEQNIKDMLLMLAALEVADAKNGDTTEEECRKKLQNLEVINNALFGDKKDHTLEEEAVKDVIYTEDFKRPRNPKFDKADSDSEEAPDLYILCAIFHDIYLQSLANYYVFKKKGTPFCKHITPEMSEKDKFNHIFSEIIDNAAKNMAFGAIFGDLIIKFEKKYKEGIGCTFIKFCHIAEKLFLDINEDKLKITLSNLENTKAAVECSTKLFSTVFTEKIERLFYTKESVKLWINEEHECKGEKFAEINVFARMQSQA